MRDLQWCSASVWEPCMLVFVLFKTEWKSSAWKYRTAVFLIVKSSILSGAVMCQSGHRVEAGKHTATGNASRAIALPAKISYWISSSTTYQITSYSAMCMKKIPMRNTNLEKEWGNDYTQWSPTEQDVCVLNNDNRYYSIRCLGTSHYVLGIILCTSWINTDNSLIN